MKLFLHRYIIDTKRTVFEKIMWSVLVLFGICLAIHQIQERIGYFLQHPTSVNIRLENNPVINFPHVTICNENLLMKSVAEREGKNLPLCIAAISR